VALAVPFGQYVPGNSAVHQLDVRMKLLLVVAYVFALFVASRWVGLLLCAVALFSAYRNANIPLRLAARGLKPVLFILAFTVLINMFTFAAAPPEAATDAIDASSAVEDFIQLPTSIALIGSFGLSPAGFMRGLYFALRITLLVSVTSLLTFTSSIVSLTDAIASLLRPLRTFKVPVEDIATMFTIALRFIPLTAEEAEKIMVAQSARGARFSEGGLIRRVKAWVPVMIPLFVSLFRRADGLAAAMESRCYQGEGRTRLKTTTLHPSDAVIGIVGTVLFIALGVVL